MLIFFPKMFPLKHLKPSYPIMNADLVCLVHSPSLTPRTNSHTCQKNPKFSKQKSVIIQKQITSRKLNRFVWICLKDFIFLCFVIFFLYSISFFFHLMGYFCIVRDHIIVCCFVFFRRIFIAFTSFFWSLFFVNIWLRNH